MSKIDEYSKKIKSKMDKIQGAAEEKIKNAQQNIEKISRDLPKKLGEDNTEQETDFDKWIKENPKKFYGIIAVALVLVFSLSAWGVVQSNIKKAEMQAKIEQEKAKIKEEESRDYFIKVEDVNTDCGATFNSSTDSLGCNKIKISGEFSKYETVELRESFSSDNSLDINGGKFEKNKESSFGLYQFYSRDNYNPQDTNFFEEKVTFEIFNKVLNKVVKSKTATIRYNLTDEDKNLFVNKFNEYKNKKQAEAEEQQRKQVEWEAIREKEEADRKNAEALKKQQEEANKKSQNSGQELPSDILPEDIISLCEREIEDLGYKNASIDVSNQYAMGIPENIYVVVGKLSKKEKLFGSREQIGTIQCQANWKTWSLESVTINGIKLI
ncbi:MAG: hypothetical protein WAV68_02820 [Candidatus Nanogingivalis sp.]